MRLRIAVLAVVLALGGSGLAHAAGAPPERTRATRADDVRSMVSATVAFASHGPRWKRQGYVPTTWKLTEVVPLRVESNSGSGESATDFDSWIVAVGLVWRKPNGDDVANTVVANWDGGKRTSHKYFEAVPPVMGTFIGPEHELHWAMTRARTWYSRQYGEPAALVDAVTVASFGAHSFDQPVKRPLAFWVITFPGGKAVCVNDRSGAAFAFTRVVVPGFLTFEACIKPDPS